MTQPRPLIAPLSAVVGGLLLFVALLTGHCPRPILAPHAAPVAVSAASVADRSDAAAVPADHSCVTQSPLVLATSDTAPVDAPRLQPSDARPLDAVAGDATAASVPSRAPPDAAPTTIDLCVLRV